MCAETQALSLTPREAHTRARKCAVSRYDEDNGEDDEDEEEEEEAGRVWLVRTDRVRLIPRNPPRDIIYTGGVESGRGRKRERVSGGGGGVRGLTATTLAMVVAVPWVMGRRGGCSSATLAPGHDSRAPVFEYNALYCPRHIIYLPVK